MMMPTKPLADNVFSVVSESMAAVPALQGHPGHECKSSSEFESVVGQFQSVTAEATVEAAFVISVVIVVELYCNAVPATAVTVI